ncbi:hypothetical protein METBISCDRAFT_24514 [Metschnikowia bicuspidata]|uniref:Uncharacterized protein n=1 Tax=Metschnikowia bicuspidata TaxID=27322 RepID=A0A4P9Z9Z8_9ASCO|nr:hypothetical protein METBISCDRAFT_24514 [Metschnikowia bicuspidata]
MALHFTSTTIHAKLDDLSISSPPKEALNAFYLKIEPFSTNSLLSNSLHADSTYPSKPLTPVMFPGMNLSHLRDEHPEPPLLATSVGSDSEGRMLPSSSTISLLSLSNNSNSNNNSIAPNNMNRANCSCNIDGNTSNSMDFPYNSSKLLGQNITLASMERGNSFSSLRSRKSFSYVSQQTLQHYQRMTSTALPTGVEFPSIFSSQNIPLKRNFSSLFTSSSQSLDPTSVANSPSGFWSSSQTPPGYTSSLGIYKGISTKLGGIHHITPVSGAVGLERQGLLHLGSKHVNIQRSGSDSPVLYPVQTPLEDMPITPLYLNPDSNSYFVLSHSNGGLQTNVSFGFETGGIDEAEEDD